jgi:hypothetical protein
MKNNHQEEEDTMKNNRSSTERAMAMNISEAAVIHKQPVGGEVLHCVSF